MNRILTIVAAGLITALILSVIRKGDTIASQRFDNSLDRLVVTFRSGRVIHVDIAGGVIDFDSLTA